MKTELERLAGARPQQIYNPADLVDDEKRTRLIDSIVSTRQRARSARWVTMTIVLPTALASTAALTAVVVAHVSPPPDRAPARAGAPTSASKPPPAPDMRDVSYVVNRVTAAVADSRRLIEHHTVTWQGCSHETWIAFSAAGLPQERDRMTCGGRLTQDSTIRFADRSHGLMKWISYPDRAWASATWDIGDDDPASALSSAETASELAQDLAGGRVELLGTEHINGRAVLHLRTVPLPGDPTPVQYRGSVWVDASTYLVARTVEYKHRLPIQNDYAWLPRTPADLAVFTMSVPSGFRHNPKLPYYAYR